MPYEFDFDSENRILRCRFEGCVTDESLEDYRGAEVRYVALTVPRAGILDFSAVTSFEVTPDTIRELASAAPAEVRGFIREHASPCGNPRESSGLSAHIRA